MIEKVAAALDRMGLEPGGRNMGVAVSGGADSVFLLYALSQLGLASVVIHVNHQLRGAESDADEDFVRGLAAALELPVRVKVAPVGDGNLEQEARSARYAFFAELQNETLMRGTLIPGHKNTPLQLPSGPPKRVSVTRCKQSIAKVFSEEPNCRTIATGHTLDDQAETVLYRFLRGAGTAGLSGIREGGLGSFCRPLLGLRRDEIRAWLTERNIAWREDASNSNLDFARNRIRLNHLPDLSASLNPSLPELLAGTASWAAAEEDYWNQEISRLAPTFLNLKPESVLIATRPFLVLPIAVQRRLLRFAIEHVRGSLRSIDFRHGEAIRALMAHQEGSGRIQLPGLDVYRSFDWLRFAPPGFDSRIPRDFEMPLAVPGRTVMPDRPLVIETELVASKHVYNVELSAIDRERCSGGWTLRNWRPGDCYVVPGRSGAVKVKTLFQEYRIPLWERRNWPVIVAEGGQIVWSRKFGPASEFAADAESRSVVIIRDLKESNPAPSTSIELKRVHGAGLIEAARDAEVK